MRNQGLESVAISCVFAPIYRAMEERAAAIVSEEAPGVSDHDLEFARPDRLSGA